MGNITIFNTSIKSLSVVSVNPDSVQEIFIPIYTVVVNPVNSEVLVELAL